ncbi:MAG: metalloregulator ArsR/SmtB family transcription factor [Peptococcaceae bacterium]|nr:metalloregulator ArsR/SmtB family transcription factor [Peptococcaceae bacterium]
MQRQKIAEFYKALGDETRLNIVNMLAAQEMCVCEIIDQLGLSQPAVSHHLKILRQAGIVNDTREGKWIYYSINMGVFELVFSEEAGNVLESYAEPLKQLLVKAAPSHIRKDPGLCERLNNKHQIFSEELSQEF